MSHPQYRIWNWRTGLNAENALQIAAASIVAIPERIGAVRRNATWEQPLLPLGRELPNESQNKRVVGGDIDNYRTRAARPKNLRSLNCASHARRIVLLTYSRCHTLREAARAPECVHGSHSSRVVPTRPHPSPYFRSGVPVTWHPVPDCSQGARSQPSFDQLDLVGNRAAPPLVEMHAIGDADVEPAHHLLQRRQCR